MKTKLSTEQKKFFWYLAIVFFLVALGIIFYAKLLSHDSSTYASPPAPVNFRGPTGPPHVNGPTGPPPSH